MDQKAHEMLDMEPDEGDPLCYFRRLRRRKVTVGAAAGYATDGGDPSRRQAAALPAA